jgi:RNA polymerase sigma factor (sigma-70 family)
MRDDERDDRQLLDAARGGDGQAFGAFYRRRRDVVLAYVGRRTGDPELAADLLAETFAAALLAVLDRARELPREPVAWLMTIAHNELIDSLRRGQVERAARERLALERLALEPLALDDEDLERIEELMDATDVEATLLELLSAQQLDALRARILDERDYAQIARELRCSEAVVRKRVSRALRTLALVAVLVLLASTVLGGGSRSRATRPRPRSAAIALGLPPRGRSRLSSLSVADPAGGPAWGMRVVHTGTNLYCLQIGRFVHGRLRPLAGMKGDGAPNGPSAAALRRLPPSVSPRGVIGSGVVEIPFPHVTYSTPRPGLGDCGAPGTAFSYDPGVEQVAAPSRPAGYTQARAILFGLLGPDALSVTYRVGGRSHTQAVEAGTGAYLIVLPRSGAITAVTYRSGARPAARVP